MANNHIPTEEVSQDIADTEAEIAVMEREERGFRIVGDRWSVMRADARVTGIAERKVFIEKLKKLLVDREGSPEK